MAQTPRTELFNQIRSLVEDVAGFTDDDESSPIATTVEKILTLTHQCYRAQGEDFIIDIHSSPFEDKVLTQIVCLTYRDLFRQFSMAQLALQTEATLDFTADPLTELKLGFSRATCQLLESMWRTFTDKMARTQAKAELDLKKARAEAANQ